MMYFLPWEDKKKFLREHNDQRQACFLVCFLNLQFRNGPVNPTLFSLFSGRLADPTGKTDCGHKSGDHLCISVDSWWAGEYNVKVKSQIDDLSTKNQFNTESQIEKQKLKPVLLLLENKSIQP